jgi:hypothetical protein
MGCWHGWHGCGPCCGPPGGPGWYEPADWYEEAGPPIGRRRRYRRFERGPSADELEARLADLRGEMRRVESELSELRNQEAAAAEGP